MGELPRGSSKFCLPQSLAKTKTLVFTISEPTQSSVSPSLMLSSRFLTGLSFHSTYSSPFPASTSSSLHQPLCSCFLPHLSIQSLDAHASDSLTLSQHQTMGYPISFSPGGGPSGGEEGDQEEESNGISVIQVERQKYIPVSKAELMDAIVSVMLPNPDDARQFHLLTSCMDSILHAEHKSILEEMRNDYSLSQSEQNERSFQVDKDSESLPNNKVLHSTEIGQTEIGCMEEDGENDGDTYPMLFSRGLDLINILNSSVKNGKRHINGDSRVAGASRFQRAFIKLLKDAQFEELSERDLMLTSALNTDYLLTLPIYVDWKRASESNAIIFRRGYTTETQKGLLIVEKLDYLQSKLLRGLFSIISKPLGKLGLRTTEAFRNALQKEETQEQLKRLNLWIKEISTIQKSFNYKEQSPGNLLEEDQISNADLPIWLAAQTAVTRYEGILSSIGPRGRLLRRLLSWIGLLPLSPEKPFKLDNNTKTSEPYLRPSFLSRITISDIWRPASKKYCGNDIWKRFKTSISLLLSQSILQEPAFQELILLYTKEVDEGDAENKVAIPSLQLKIYERIPIPDLPVIFPDKKLSFRIIDSVRLDTATILGLLAFFINYKFENVLSSPSAVFLDVVAVSALIIYITRVCLGYKQTWDRYQLLVNKTLYEKTLASGFGSVHFLLDASEQQQYKEAVLAYAILLKEGKDEGLSEESIEDRCERFMYDQLKVKVKMPVEKAMDTLKRLGLASRVKMERGDSIWKATPCWPAYEALKQRWNTLIA